MKLIEALKQKQKEEGLTDRQMAEKMGMHHITWVNKKNLKRPLSPKDNQTVLKIYPDLMSVFLTEIAN